MEQRSPEWFAARCGRFTASSAAKLMSKGRGSAPSVQRADLISTIVVERLTGVVEPGYVNAAMQRGIDLEPEALDAYAFASGQIVEPAGFVPHPDMDFVGCSPDGYIGDDGLVEVKCPDNIAKHLSYLENDAHAAEYRWQLQFQLFVTGRAFVDIVSYDPRYPGPMQLATRRIDPSEEDQAAIADALTAAEADVRRRMADLQARFDMTEAA